jgi:hypothetical protein
MSDDVRERFAEHADRWEAFVEENAASSNPFTYVRHPDFEAIVALGRPAVPLIVERYRDGSLFWGAALARLVERAGFGDGVTGNLRDTRERWLAWWDDNGDTFA